MDTPIIHLRIQDFLRSESFLSSGFIAPPMKDLLHQSTAASTWWCGPRPRLGLVEMVVGLPEGPSYPGTPLELRRATCPEESLTRPFALLSLSLNFLRLPPTSPSPPLDCHRQSCLSHAKAPSLLWHGFSSSHLQSFLDFAFLSFHMEDIFYYSHPQDGKSLSTLLLLSGLSLSLSASQSFLNASFYPVYSFFWNLIPFSFPARPVSALDGLH